MRFKDKIKLNWYYLLIWKLLIEMLMDRQLYDSLLALIKSFTNVENLFHFYSIYAICKSIKNASNKLNLNIRI